MAQRYEAIDTQDFEARIQELEAGDVSDLPPGGTGGQLLAKQSATDFDAAWVSPSVVTGTLPEGGTADQLLTKLSSLENDADWVTHDFASTGSPGFTGTPTAPTAAPGTSTTQVATTAFVTAADALKANINSPALTGTPTTTAPPGGDSSTRIATTAFVAAANAGQAQSDSPVFTGVPTGPTAAPGTSSTQLATTAFVTAGDALKANIASPTLTGTPTAPTAIQGTSTTQLATTAFVAGSVSSFTSVLPLTFASLGLANDGTDQKAKFIAAVLTAGGRPIDGEGKTYHLDANSGATQLSPNVNVDIRNVTLANLNPLDGTASRPIYWNPNVELTMRLRNVKIDMGSNRYHGDLANNAAAIYVAGNSKAHIDFESVEITGNFRGVGCRLLSCINPRVVNIYIHDCTYGYEGDATITEPLNAITIADPVGSVYVENPQIHRIASMLHWITGDPITRGQQRRWYGANSYYTTAASGTTGAVPPTHTSGTVAAADGIPWTWLGDVSQSLRYYNANAMSCSGVSGSMLVVGGHISFTGEGMDCSGGPVNNEITFIGTVFEDCDGYGFKCAHTYRKIRLYSVVSRRAAISPFVFASDAVPDNGSDIALYDCHSVDPGWVTGYGNVWPGTHYGYMFTGPNDRVKLHGCTAEIVSGSMTYGVRDETGGGGVQVDEHFQSIGHSVAATGGVFEQGAKHKLGANTNLYVRPDGNDANNGYLNDATHAFLTIQAAVDKAASLDLNGKTLVVQLADGTYTGAVTISGLLSGQGTSASFVITGNAATPGNVHVNIASGSAFTVLGGGRVRLSNMKISAAAGSCIDIQNHSVAEFGGIVFGTTNARHVSVVRNSRASAFSNYEIAGNAAQSFLLQYNSYLEINNRTVTIASALNFSGSFIQVAHCSSVRADVVTYTGAGVAGTTGKRYDVVGNAVLVTGTGGVNLTYFPGSIAGTTSVGGEYN